MDDPEISARLSASSEASNLNVRWFSGQRKKEVKRAIAQMKSQGTKVIRLGISCAEFNATGGVKWYNWLLPTLAAHFELVLCFDNFSRKSELPASKQRSLPQIVEYCILRHGKSFKSIELWRNPSQENKRNAIENIFADDLVFAGTWAKYWGKKVSLGRVKSSDFEWIEKLDSASFLRNIESIEVIPEGIGEEWSDGTRYSLHTLMRHIKAKAAHAEKPAAVGSRILPTAMITKSGIAC